MTKTIEEARGSALALTKETNADGFVVGYRLGNRQLRTGDVVERFLRAGSQSRWEEAIVGPLGVSPVHLTTDSCIHRLTFDSLLRWPEGKGVA